MPLYNFKKIAPVPAGREFIDIVLSRTQRKTPTQCHAGWGINRIRQFYMRKVKFTQQTWHDKLTRMLDEFPRLDDIHPFYADLCNVLYDRSHYKLALGQINMARQLIDNIAKDYVRLLKYADSQYRSKQLKRAALGRMCTLMKKLNPSLGYLEEVRKHLSRLPSIDPNTRTLLICGYPNVGKSSFMNKVTRADVDVQPYAFTTKSLFVGHMDYKYLRWQVIDTPGILDHPLEERNTIEMCAITALAHLQCTVLYFIDPSETCGYTIQQQQALFDSIKPLFANKPLMVVYTKTDLARVQDLPDKDRAPLEEWYYSPTGAGMDPEKKPYEVSSQNEDGITDVKLKACDMLLEKRVSQKLRGKKIANVLNRLTVAVPTKRDDVPRGAQIPDSVVQEKKERDDGGGAAALGEAKRTQKDIMWENGGPGQYLQSWREHWDLKNAEWKTDRVPEIMDGKNIADFVDPDIMEKLEALEREEEQLEEAYEVEKEMEDDGSDIDEEDKRLVKEIRKRRKVIVARHRRNKGGNRSAVPLKHTTKASKAFNKGLQEVTGSDSVQVRGRKRERSLSRPRHKGTDHSKPYLRSDRSVSRVDGRSISRATHTRSQSKTPRDREGVPRQAAKKVRKMMKQGQKKLNVLARAGTSDRHIAAKMPKHLYSGKRPKGTADRR
jgi:nucleolar GTP-binding protein